MRILPAAPYRYYLPPVLSTVIGLIVPIMLTPAVRGQSAYSIVAADVNRDGKVDLVTTDRDNSDFEPVHDSSPTDHVLTELQLHGHRPFQDQPDPRPLPEAQVITGAVADIFDALVATPAQAVPTPI